VPSRNGSLVGAPTSGAPGDGTTPATERPRRLRRVWRDPRFVVPALILLFLALVATFPQLVGAGDPYACDLARSLDGPSLANPFGFDLQGCDYYTRTLYAGRASLLVGLFVVLVSGVVGLFLGSLVGFYEGPLDAIVGRLGDAFIAMPLVLTGAIVLMFVEDRGILQVTLVLALLAWAPMVRLVRAQVLQTKQQVYVEAARALGARDARILRKHVIPNALWPIVIYASAYVAVAITAEAILSFFGVGLSLPAISWGVQLNQVRERILLAPHLLAPAIFLSITVAAFVFIGEALRSASDPDGAREDPSAGS
jgi:oligopeptide transport system permease protein